MLLPIDLQTLADFLSSSSANLKVTILASPEGAIDITLFREYPHRKDGDPWVELEQTNGAPDLEAALREIQEKIQEKLS